MENEFAFPKGNGADLLHFAGVPGTIESAAREYGKSDLELQCDVHCLLNRSILFICHAVQQVFNLIADALRNTSGGGCMYFLFCALISILWGCLSPWLFLNGWLAFLGMIAVILALIQGKLEFDRFLRNIFRTFSELIFNFILLGAGFYIIYRYYALGRTTSEVILYWIVASLQVCYLLTDISRKIDLLIEKSQQ